MFKYIFLCCLCFFFFLVSKAQKHNNEIVVNGQASVSSGQTRIGLGGFLEGLYGTGKSAQLSFTTGIFVFHGRPYYNPDVVTQIIPFQIGYKQNFKKFFLQPQAGYGALNGKIETNGDISRPSIGTFLYGLKVGFNLKRIKVGLSFQQVTATESLPSKISGDKNFNYSGLYIGYSIFK